MSDDWNIDVDVKDVKAATGGVQVGKGYYRGIVKDVEKRKSTAGNDRIVLVVTITEPEDYAGIDRTTGINVPKDDTQRAYFRAALEALGHDKADLDSGSVSLGPNSFLGREGQFYYEPGDRSRNIWDTFQWLPEEVFEARKEMFIKRNGAAVIEVNQADAPARGSGASNTGNSSPVPTAYSAGEDSSPSSVGGGDDPSPQKDVSAMTKEELLALMNKG